MQKKSSSNAAVSSNCPCGSGETYISCCYVVHTNHTAAKNPEMLMRARYTAFVLANSDFLVKSWATETRPDNLEINQETRWLGLRIIDNHAVAETSKEATVSFEASFIEKDKHCILKETSNFRKISGKWYYLDGKTKLDSIKLYGKTSCPCGSGKKYKRCCAVR